MPVETKIVIGQLSMPGKYLDRYWYIGRYKNVDGKWEPVSTYLHADGKWRDSTAIYKPNSSEHAFTGLYERKEDALTLCKKFAPQEQIVEV